jgi:hypothetical protein
VSLNWPVQVELITLVRCVRWAIVATGASLGFALTADPASATRPMQMSDRLCDVATEDQLRLVFSAIVSSPEVELTLRRSYGHHRPIRVLATRCLPGGRDIVLPQGKAVAGTPETRDFDIPRAHVERHYVLLILQDPRTAQNFQAGVALLEGEWRVITFYETPTE